MFAKQPTTQNTGIVYGQKPFLAYQAPAEGGVTPISSGEYADSPVTVKKKVKESVDGKTVEKEIEEPVLIGDDAWAKEHGLKPDQPWTQGLLIQRYVDNYLQNHPDFDPAKFIFCWNSKQPNKVFVHTNPESIVVDGKNYKDVELYYQLHVKGELLPRLFDQIAALDVENKFPELKNPADRQKIIEKIAEFQELILANKMKSFKFGQDPVFGEGKGARTLNDYITFAYTKNLVTNDDTDAIMLTGEIARYEQHQPARFALYEAMSVGAHIVECNPTDPHWAIAINVGKGQDQENRCGTMLVEVFDALMNKKTFKDEYDAFIASQPAARPSSPTMQ